MLGQAPQGPEATPAATPDTGVGFLEAFTEEPALLELAVVLFVFAIFWLLMWRAGRIAETARSRAALADYLLGVEQALAGDLKGASKRLQRVLKEAPENQAARLLYGEVLAELGEPAQAHKHHLELQRAFRMESPRNDMARARSLLAGGGDRVLHPEGAGFGCEHAWSADTHLEDFLIDDVEAGQKAEPLVFFDEDVDGSLYLGHPPLNLSDFVGEKCLFALEFQDVVSG